MPRAEDIREVRLQDGDVTLSLLNLGCITRGWWVPLAGERVPVVLGYADPARYLADRIFTGTIVGRVANRIGGARFALDGQDHRLAANEGTNQLHGGPGGLHARIWTVAQDGDRAVRFTYASPEGEEGYPGRAEFEVAVTLECTRVTYDMRARVDRPTPINMAQHNYYSLGVDRIARVAHFTCRADRYTLMDEALIPTGAVAPVSGTPLDFRNGARFDDNDPDGHGIDRNLVMPEGRAPAQPMAEVLAPNGLRLRMWSDKLGLQVYTGQGLPTQGGAHAGQRFAPWNGLALEAQGFPDAVNQPGFPGIIVTPEAPYRHRMTVEIGIAP